MMGNIECWLGSFVIFQGIRTIAKKPYIFVTFKSPSESAQVVRNVSVCPPICQ